MRRRLRSFEGARGLAIHQLRAVLAGGARDERVWAAWSLGLAIGGESGMDAPAPGGGDPHPGLRKHLVAVLAGRGEDAAVRALALEDPDPYVRAAAYRYASKAGAGGDELWRSSICDPDEVVRQQGIRLLEGRWPPALRPELIALLLDEAVGVRQAAAERLADEQLAPEEIGVVARRVLTEPDGDLRRQLVRICVGAGGGEALARALPDLPTKRLTELLDVLLHSEVRLAWRELAAVASRALPAVDHRVLQLLRAPEEADLGWLARCAVRPLSWPSPRNQIEVMVTRDVRRAAALATRAVLAKIATGDSDPALPTAEDRAALATLLQSLRRAESDLDGSRDDLLDGSEWDPERLARLAGDRRTLEAFLARAAPYSSGS